MKHLSYLRYLLRHKFYVMLACFRYGLIWQGIVHDWSKFLPGEWRPYVEMFYGRAVELRRQHKTAQLGLSIAGQNELGRLQDAFDRAWLLHQHRSPHHWQHWVLREDSGDTKIMRMPRRYMLEMLADWEGAGRAITGQTGTTPGWYLRNRKNIILHWKTRLEVEKLLGINASNSAPV